MYTHTPDTHTNALIPMSPEWLILSLNLSTCHSFLRGPYVQSPKENKVDVWISFIL